MLNILCDNVTKASLHSYVCGFKESLQKKFPSNTFIKKSINILWYETTSYTQVTVLVVVG